MPLQGGGIGGFPGAPDTLTGYGVGGGGPAGIYVVETALKTLLLGADAAAVEDLWQRMYQATDSEQ